MAEGGGPSALSAKSLKEGARRVGLGGKGGADTRALKAPPLFCQLFHREQRTYAVTPPPFFPALQKKTVTQLFGYVLRTWRAFCSFFMRTTEDI
jgi:hypothetical protein